MQRRINPKHMEAWVDKLQSNMRQFLEKGAATPEQQLTFIRHQYALLSTTIKVLNGNVYFVGCPQSKN